MESESGSKGSKPGFARELRQGQIARRQEAQRGEMSNAEVLVWSQAWMEVWPRAKSGAKIIVREFGQHQGGLWTRVQENAWLEAELVEAIARARAEVAWTGRRCGQR